MGKWFQDKSFSTGKREKGIKARKVYRALGILLAATLVFQTVPFEGISVSASESSGGGLCEHHGSHTPDCGYKEAEPGHACTHEHTEDCYRTVEGEDGSTTKELDCHHEHDEECGYREAAEGSRCTFVCEICKGGTDETPQDKTDGNGINEGDSENPGTENGDEMEEPGDGQEALDAANTPDLVEEGTPDLELFGQKVCSGDSGDGWSYADGVLTLADYHSDNSSEVFIHITNADLEFTLYLKGDNSVKTSEKLIYGNAFGSTTITGDQGASLSLDGKSWADRYIFIRGVNVDVTTQGMIFISYDMEIDNAAVNFNMNGSSGYIYTTHGGFTIKNGSDVTITNSSGAVDYCVATNKTAITDSALKITNPSGFGVYVTKISSQASEYKASIANSTISACVSDAGIHCEDEVSVIGSQVINSGQFLIRSKKAITVDDSSTMEGITYEFFNSDTGAAYQVYGSHTLAEDLTVSKNGSFVIPKGAALTIPDGVTLENNGTMCIHEKDSLTGTGALTGNGKSLIDVNEDMISVPEGLVYTGKDYTDQITLEENTMVCGVEFTADTEGWTRNIEPAVVKEAGEYTVTFTSGNKEISKTFTVAQSGTQFVGDGVVKTYKGSVVCSDFTADDTITVKATPTATGKAPAKAAARLRGSEPAEGQMAVFVGDIRVSDAASANSDGSYTMTVSAADVLEQGNVEPNGGPVTLTAKFVGNDNMADGAGTVEVSISAVAKIKNGSFTTYVGESGLDAVFALNSGNNGATITLLANVTRVTTLAIKVNCTLDLNGHNIKSTNQTCLAVDGLFAVTIQGEGEIISEQAYALFVAGSVTLEGGTFTSNGKNFAGVYVNSEGVSLSVTENVTIQNTGGGYGLAVSSAQSVQLSGGTYSGGTAVIAIVSQSSSLTLGDLLGHSGDTRYAYFDESGIKPITGKLDDKELTGTVTVGECTHDKSVCAYTPNGDADTHAMTCRACGLEEAAADCQLTYTPDSDGTHHTAACETCGRSRTEAHSYGSWTPQHNGTAVTIRRVCKSCGYTKTDGTFTASLPGQTMEMEYGKPITLTCTSTLPDATFQWILRSFNDTSTVQESTGASFTPSETLAVGEYMWNARVTWAGSDGNTIAKSGPLSVLPAPLSNVNVTLSPANAVYNGTAQKPAVAIDGLTEGTDYTVAYMGDFTNAGEHTATVTGKGNYEGTVTKTFTIEKAEQTDFAFAAVTKPYEKNGTFTLSTTGGGGNGAVLYRVPENNGVLMVNGDKAAIIGVGTVTITATKAESDNYKAATATGKITITKAPAPTITYPAAGGIAYGQELSDSVLTGGSTEYGTFAWENGSIIPIADNTGYTVVFTASEETKKNYETITDMTQKVPVKVEQAVPAVSVTAAVFGSKDNRQAVLTVNAAKAGAGAFPTGTVAFMDCTGSTEVEIGTATLSKGSASYTWDGLQDKTYTIKAVYKGNSNYREAESRELTFDAAKQNQQDFSLDAIGAKTYGDAAIPLKTIGGSGSGAVRYESSDEDVIRIEDGRAVIVGAGTATITAIKEGDKIYNEASASRNVTVAKKALTVRADNRTVVRGKPMPAFTYRADGLVNGDTFTTAPSITAGVQDTDTLGKYDIVINGGTLQNSESYHITYVNGTLHIVERFYTVTVTDGTGGGEYAEGDTVTVTANERNGYTFTGWSGEDSVAFADSKAKTTNFTMPAKSVTVKANYTRNSSSGNNGGGSGDGGNSGGSGNNGGIGGNSASEGNARDNRNNGGQGSIGGGSTNPGNGNNTPQIPVIPPAKNTIPGNEATPGTGTTPVNPGIGNTVRPGTGSGHDAGTAVQGTKQPFIKGEDGKIGWDVTRAEEEMAQEGRPWWLAAAILLAAAIGAGIALTIKRREGNRKQ